MNRASQLLMLPGPTNVPSRITAAMQKPIINHRGEEFQQLYHHLIESLKYTFQTKNDVFPITASGTGAVESAIGNVVSKGDKVLVPTYGVFSERLREAAVRYGAIPIEARYEWGLSCKAEDVQRLLEDHPDIAAVAIVYNETSTGVAARDLPQISRLTRKYGKLLIVDAVSALGGDTLPVDEWNIDICITGSQKCLACPPGLSMISASQRAYETIERNKQRPFYFDLIAHRDYASRLETPFTPAIPLFYALEEALIILKEEGLENRIKRHKACGDAFYAGFERMGFKLLAARDVRSNTVISIQKPDEIDDRKFREHLLTEHRVAIGGGMGKLKGKLFRVGSMGIVSREHVTVTLEAFMDTLKSLGYSTPFSRGDVLQPAEGIPSKL